MSAGDVSTLEEWVHLNIDCCADEVKRIERPHGAGTSADFVLPHALHQLEVSREKLQLYIVPCVRREAAWKIEAGTHLSFFFLLLVVGSASHSAEGIDQLLCRLQLSPNLSEAPRIWLRPVRVGPARGVPFSGRGVEIIGGKIEVARHLQLFDSFGLHVANLLGVGIERLLMHSSKEEDIWRTRPFKPLAGENRSRLSLDELRKHAFLLRGASGNPAVEMSLLRGFSGRQCA